MCERYDPSPGIDAIAPDRLRRILKRLGPLYVLPNDCVVLAEHTLEMVRLVHDTLGCQLGRLPDLTDYSFVDFGQKGEVFIGYFREIIAELTGRSVDDTRLFEALAQGPMLMLPKVQNQQPLNGDEYTKLNQFIRAFVQMLNNQAARCM